MTNELIVSQQDNHETFIAKLNAVTGFTGGLPNLVTIKFNAEDGVFERSTDKKDEDGKVIFEPMGEELTFHILTMRKMVQSAYKEKVKLHSREFDGDFVELLDQDDKVVAKGFYADLKEDKELPELVYVQVLYVMVDDQPYRLKLSRSKLVNFFPYLKSFNGDNPARWYTRAVKGSQLTNGAIKYYELLFERGDEILDQQFIAKRVNDVNYYIAVKSRARSEDYSVPQEEVMPTAEVEAGADVEVE